jgi:hypothetical protein
MGFSLGQTELIGQVRPVRFETSSTRTLAAVSSAAGTVLDRTTTVALDKSRAAAALQWTVKPNHVASRISNEARRI